MWEEELGIKEDLLEFGAFLPSKAPVLTLHCGPPASPFLEKVLSARPMSSPAFHPPLRQNPAAHHSCSSTLFLTQPFQPCLIYWFLPSASQGLRTPTPAGSRGLEPHSSQAAMG